MEFNYSIDFEVERIKEVLKKIPWYKEKGYDIKKLRIPTSNLRITDKGLYKLVEGEFKESAYGKAKKKLMDYEPIVVKLITELNRIFKSDKKSINVFITRYGTGGSYSTPKSVVINASLSNTHLILFHEIVHLYIEPFVKKYKIDHWKKERVVDLILNSERFNFLEYGGRWQGDYNGTDNEVDQEFNLLFDNPEKFFKSIS